MLVELQVTNLGVIEKLRLDLGRGMTVVTGETGAGKTLIVGAIELLLGGRADPAMVRTGAAEAVVDGRFVLDGVETVLSRVVPAEGRSRAYVDGRPVTASELGEQGARLAEIHGQHAHQRLLDPRAQRAALDAFGGIDTSALDSAVAEVRAIRRELDDLGGDERAIARQRDVLAFQLAEIDEAAITDPGEDDRLQELEGVLGSVAELRSAAGDALAGLVADGAARDRVAKALGRLRDVAVGDHLASVITRLDAVVNELDDVAAELRSAVDGLDDDPARLTTVQQRRRQLTALRRKYGATLGDVLAEASALRRQIAQIDDLDGLRAGLAERLGEAESVWRSEAEGVARARRAAAPALADAVSRVLDGLGMPDAVVEVAVAGGEGDRPDAGEDVTFLLAANPGSPAGPLARIASGGELSRVMLALRLVLSGGPGTAVFDEVDAGVGGAAALRVADALAGVAVERQVLVVTHLAQVAARADAHVRVAKNVVDGVTHTSAELLGTADRRAEIARMLAGDADSAAALRHADELLAGH